MPNRTASHSVQTFSAYSMCLITLVSRDAARHVASFSP